LILGSSIAIAPFTESTTELRIESIFGSKRTRRDHVVQKNTAGGPRSFPEHRPARLSLAGERAAVRPRASPSWCY